MFGYPLVLMDVTMAVLTNAEHPGVGRQRFNAFNHARAFPDASFTAVVSPNADTRYSTAGLDLTEPVVLSVPPSGGRYHLLPILSGWTDVFASSGSRTTGDGPGLFAITGPSWSGELPDGVQVIRSPTAMERFAAIGLTRADRSTLDRRLLRRSMTACGTACSG